VIPSGVEIFMAVEPIDLRWGFNRLSGVVSERDVRCGALFLFLGKRRDDDRGHNDEDGPRRSQPRR